MSGHLRKVGVPFSPFTRLRLPALTVVVVAAAFMLLAVRAGDARAQGAGADQPAGVGVNFVTYEQAKARDLLTFDFMLVHPKGEAARGITPEERRLVLETVKGGCAEILLKQQADGSLAPNQLSNSLAGVHAIRLWALLACGTRSSEPAIKQAVEAMARMAVDPNPTAIPGGGPDTVDEPIDLRLTYDVSLMLMAYHALAEARLREMPGYKAPDSVKDRTAEDHADHAVKLGAKLTEQETSIAKRLRRSLIRRQMPDGHWFYGSAGGIGEIDGETRKPRSQDTERPLSLSSDDSNAHFAILGLLAAHRLGLGAPSGPVLKRAADQWMRRQQKSGHHFPLSFRSDSKDPPKEEPKKGSGTRKPEAGVDTFAKGWAYHIGLDGPAAIGPGLANTRLSMTAAGVICLASIRYMMLDGATTHKGDERLKNIDVALKNGLAGLSWRMDVSDGANMIAEQAAKALRDAEAKKGKGARTGELLEEAVRLAAHEARESALTELSRVNGVVTYRGFPQYDSVIEGVKQGKHTNRIYPNDTDAYGAYTMLAVERAGILTGCDFLGSSEWYPIGVRSLLAQLEHLRPRPAPEQKGNNDEKDKTKKAKEKKDDPPEPDTPEKEQEKEKGKPKDRGSAGQAETRRKLEEMAAQNESRLRGAALAMQLLFLKGYLDKTPNGPVITGGGKPVDTSKPAPTPAKGESPNDPANGPSSGAAPTPPTPPSVPPVPPNENPAPGTPAPNNPAPGNGDPKAPPNTPPHDPPAKDPPPQDPPLD